MTQCVAVITNAANQFSNLKYKEKKKFHNKIKKILCIFFFMNNFQWRSLYCAYVCRSIRIIIMTKDNNLDTQLKFIILNLLLFF